jgi:hypothetical protein
MSTLFEKAIEAIDHYNKKDPNQEFEDGIAYPKEYLESIRHTKWINKLVPEGSEALKIAARCQHIGRWEIARSSYPMTRSGYLIWRTDLGKHHAERAGNILTAIGYTPDFIAHVQRLNLKKNIKLDPESQAIEDMLCLVFLENHIEAFSKKHDTEKLINIIQKTWKKMGDNGKKEALKLHYSSEVLDLLKKSLEL